MSTMWFVGAKHPVNTHPDVVRDTLDKTETDRSGPAEITSAPGWNQFASDKDSALVGLSPRQMSGDVHESVQSVPFWKGLATQDFESPIDSQVATSGTAARREASGQFGHGTAEYTESIEPVIREGAAYGNDYFVRAGAVIQDGAGSYMASPVPDTDWQGVAQNIGNRRSRQAYSGLYQSLIG